MLPLDTEKHTILLHKVGGKFYAQGLSVAIETDICAHLVMFYQNTLRYVVQVLKLLEILAQVPGQLSFVTISSIEPLQTGFDMDFGVFLLSMKLK